MTGVEPRALLSEFLGTAFLLAGVVGSGIMAEQLTNDVGLQLLQNAIATGAVLVALILTFGDVSGAHFNPVVTLGFVASKELSLRAGIGYVCSQVSGAIVGVGLANLMFDLQVLHWSTKPRDEAHQLLAEGVATVGLLLVIFGVVRSRQPSSVAVAVGAYITAAYYFTSSTSFANPAVTVARTMSDTFAGIEPASAPLFVVLQLLGAAVAVGLIRILWPTE